MSFLKDWKSYQNAQPGTKSKRIIFDSCGAQIQYNYMQDFVIQFACALQNYLIQDSTVKITLYFSCMHVT